MINLRILVPESTINYVTNPSFRFATTGWNTQGATITRSLDQARFGIASGKVVTAGLAAREGVNFRVSSLSGVSEPITISIYLRGAGKVRLRLDNNVVGGGEQVSQTIELTDRWERYEVTGFSTGGNDLRLWVETDDTTGGVTTPRAYTFYIDGAQLERKAYSTSYCDGDQPGCRWNIVSNASVSSRTADTREGGKWVNLAGPCTGSDDIYVTVLGGFGMPPIQNQMQPWSQEPGSYFQNKKIMNRVSTMNFFVKSENLRSIPPPSTKKLHELREKLIDIFKPDLTIGDEAFVMEYKEDEATRPIYMKFRYDGGLEGSWDVRNGWVNGFPLRVIAVDPMAYEDNQNVMQLGTKSSYGSSIRPFWGRLQGQWSSLITLPANSKVTVIKIAPSGLVYLGYVDSGSNNYFASWDGSTLTNIAATNASGSVLIRSIEVAPDGSIYIGGDFTSLGGVAATRIIKYNPATGAFTAMGSGLNNTVRTICAAKNGNIYVGGDFTTAGGISCLRIAYWDGLQWRTVGATSGMNGQVFTIVRGNDSETLYLGGAFTASNGGSVSYGAVASLNTTTNLFSTMGYGMNSGANVFAMCVGLDGTVYAGGNFTASGLPGTSTLLRIAQYKSGNLWSPMGAGLSGGSVTSMCVGVNGEVYASGLFTSSGPIPMQKMGRWLNNAWTHIEFNPAVTISVGITGLDTQKNGDLYVITEAQSATQTYYPYYNTVTNEGSSEVFPVMYIQGQGTLRYIENIKTGQALYLNLPISPGEEVFMDFAKGTIESTTRGSLLYTILPGSEIRAIKLLPGQNTFGVYMDNEVNPIMQIQYTPQHWSFDAVVDADPLV